MKLDKLALLGIGALAFLGLKNTVKTQNNNQPAAVAPTNTSVNPTLAVEPKVATTTDNFRYNTGGRQLTSYEQAKQTWINQTAAYLKARGLNYDLNAATGTATVYNANGTVAEQYNFTQRYTKADEEERQKSRVSAGGGVATETVKLTSGKSTKLYTWVDKETGKTKTAGERGYKDALEKGRVA